MTVTLLTLARLSVLLFVMCSMASMGLSLKVSQILAPLSNVKRVILALFFNFVVAPLLALGITLALPVNESIRIGLILLIVLGVALNFRVKLG